ncbi:MAG: transposase [Dehalococcoidia bacterium]
MWPDWRFAKSTRLPREAYDNQDASFHLVTAAAVGSAPFRDARMGNEVWRLLLNELDRDSVVLVAACLMPDHLHVVARPRTANLADWFGEFKSLTTRKAWRLGRRGAVWQPSFYDRRLYGGQVGAVVAYVLRNPEEANLVEDMSEWPWVEAWVSD